jgi:L-threonylcarbamoyladenylate synthase
VGIESTIVDLTRLDTHGAVILRPGAITQTMINHALDAGVEIDRVTAKTALTTLKSNTSNTSVPRVSGSLSAHYAPRTKLLVYDPKDAKSIFSKENEVTGFKQIAWVHFPKDLSANELDLKNVTKELVLPVESKALARELYALLRRLDGLNLDCIFFEKLPDGIEWDAIRDRLGRASVGSGL